MEKRFAGILDASAALSGEDTRFQRRQKCRTGFILPVTLLSMSLMAACLPASAQSVQPLSQLDVSWLFPPPRSAADLANLLAIKDVGSPDPREPGKRDPVWSAEEFSAFEALANGPMGKVDGTPMQIALPSDARSPDAWILAGIRIDAGAPGLSTEVLAQFGQRPQIRLILHPVTRHPDGSVEVHDYAAHLIYDFVLPEPDGACPIHATPDLAAFSAVVSDVVALKTRLAAGEFGGIKILTEGVPLGVHPGLLNPATAPLVASEIKAFLERHISSARLNAMSVEGLPANSSAPWIFLSMLRNGQGGFDAVRGPTLDGSQFAMMLTGLGQAPRVVPPPHAKPSGR